MTIAEYLEYDKKVNENHISDTKSYLLTYFSKITPTHDPIQEFAHYFVPNQPGAESDCDLKDMEEEVEYMTDDEVVMSEQEETSVCDEVSSIASNEMDKANDNTSNTAPCWLPKELSPGSFLLPFNINNHNFYATTTLDAKDNIMPQRVYEYLGLDKLIGTSTLENTTGTNEPLGTINILVKFGELEFSCNFVTKIDKDVIILGRPFLESTRAQIDVFNDEISFEIGPDSLSPDRRGLVKRWHVCKPIHITYDDGSGMWLTCYPALKFCFGYNEVFGVNEQGTLRQWICFRDHERRAVKRSYMGFADFLQVHYRQQKIDDTTRERRKERVCSGRCMGKCQQNYKKTNVAWHDEGYEEDEMWRSGDEKTDYDPPYVNVKTFEVKKYSFKGGRSFICITDRGDEALPLGRVNGARFIAMIRKELEGNKYVHEVT
ncbi:phospholipase-like protein [Tanacetum coccineum]|uniref:Phospholipase-like protein n=1 Tax=Tanacetum coccineum TaxID=301880 RepID=A0ABQ5GTZ6_9ASTR